MANVVVHTTLTLDGFMARPNDSIDWAFHYTGDGMVEQVMTEVGAVISGNKGEITEDALPYGGYLKVPQFVVTHKPRPPLTIGGLTFTYVNGVEEAIRLAKTAVSNKSIMLLGGTISQQAINAGLVDEIIIHLAPVLIGEGIRLFDNLAAKDIRLERTELVATGQVTSIRFRVLK